MQYAYQPQLGILYAKSFALIESVPEWQRLFYYGPEDDCANFISQCVWAAYGGWIPGFSPAWTAENGRRVLEDIRQVTGLWYGSKKHIGSTRWCRVEEFYSYATARKEFGPTAEKVAEGNFESVSPGLIREGDVIQLVVADYAPGRYGHSLYVTKAGRSYEEITICCHTYNLLDAPLSSFAERPDIYRRMRVLRFGPGSFTA